MEETKTPQENASNQMAASEKTPTPKRKGGLFKIVLAVLILAVAGGAAAWYFLGMPGVDEQPPSLELAGSKFQGQSIGEQLGSLVFDQGDVDSYQTPSGASFKMSEKGVHYFYSEQDLTVDEIIQNIKPKDGLQVLVAFYSPGEEALGTDACYYIYPKGPYGNTCEITNPANFTVPAGRGVAIIGSDSFEYNENALKGANKLASKNFVNEYVGDVQGWLLIPIKGSGDINVAAEGSVWKMTSDNKFDKVADKANPQLAGSYSLAWFKLGAPSTVEPDTETTTTTTTTTTTETTSTTPTPVCGNGDIEEGETCDDGNTTNGDGCDSACKIEKSQVDVGDRFTTTPETIKEAETATTEEETTTDIVTEFKPMTQTVTMLPPAVTKFEYISNLENQFTTDSTNWSPYMKGNLYGDKLDSNTHIIMAAMKMTVGTDLGTVRFTEIIFGNHGYTSIPAEGNEFLGPYTSEVDKQPIENYKTAPINPTTAVTNYCNGTKAWIVNAYYQEGATFFKRTLFSKGNINSSTSTTFTVDNKQEVVEFAPGTSVVITLEMEGFDDCTYPDLKKDFGDDAVSTSEANFTNWQLQKIINGNTAGEKIYFNTLQIVNNATHDHWINWIDPEWPATLTIAPLMMKVDMTTTSDTSGDTSSEMLLFTK
jgi:cysteine-rich repeat protein